MSDLTGREPTTNRTQQTKAVFVTGTENKSSIHKRSGLIKTVMTYGLWRVTLIDCFALIDIILLISLLLTPRKL